MREKKNILIVPPFNPYPLTSGGHQAIFNGIAILKDIANVYVLVNTTESKWKRGEGKEIENVLPFVKVISYIDPASKHTMGWYWRVAVNKLEAKMPKSMKHCRSVEQACHKAKLNIEGIGWFSKERAKEIQVIVKKYRIDIVQAEMMENIRLVDYIPNTIKRIFVHHELRFVRDELLASTRGELTDDIRNQLKVYKEEEIAYLNKYDEVVTLSPVDTQKLKEAGVKVPITTSFAIVSDSIEPVPYAGKTKKLLSYVGPEQHYPNYEGIMWFLENCWMKLREKEPDYQFQIIGKWSAETSEYIAQTYPGVKCVGFVKNLGDAIVGTTMIVPLNIGSGIRMKILEAARIGVPVVATPVGSEGLPLENGKHAFITADPDTFIEDIIHLHDECLRNTFVENTRKAIADKYSLTALKENRESLYI